MRRWRMVRGIREEKKCQQTTIDYGKIYELLAHEFLPMANMRPEFRQFVSRKFDVLFFLSLSLRSPIGDCSNLLLPQNRLVDIIFSGGFWLVVATRHKHGVANMFDWLHSQNENQDAFHCSVSLGRTEYCMVLRSKYKFSAFPILPQPPECHRLQKRIATQKTHRARDETKWQTNKRKMKMTWAEKGKKSCERSGRRRKKLCWNSARNAVGEAHVTRRIEYQQREIY